MSHYGTTPAQVCTAILTALSTLKLQDGGAGGGGTGCVRTIKRLAGAKKDLDAIESHLTGGLPALLVAYLGGPLKPAATHGMLYEHEMTFAIYCCAGQFSGPEDRLAGEAPTVSPGVEDLMDWATYYATRAINYDVKGLSIAHPVGHSLVRFEAGKYVGLVELRAVREMDIYDEATGNTLKKLGIVHDPLDPEQLFLADNETPNSSWPPTVDGGVADLET